MATGKPVLAHGAIIRCAKKFGVSGPAISNVWKHMKAKLEEGILTSSPLKTTPRPPPFKYCTDELMAQISALPVCKRGTLCDMANELGIGKSTLHRILWSETSSSGSCYLVPHTNSLLPLLTPEHMLAQVMYSLSKLDIDRGCFSSFLQDVHVDEK